MYLRSSLKLFYTRTNSHISAWKNTSRSKFYNAGTENETIFSLSSDINLYRGSPLAVIRISGQETKDVIELMTNKHVINSNCELENNAKHSLKLLKPREATNVKIVDPNNNNSLIDMAIAVWFPKPKSYTGEDVVEFHVHGSPAIVKKVLKILGSLEHLRPAEAGEFTRRALYNKKLSLSQAESLNALITAKTDTQLELALTGLSEKTIAKYDEWINELVGILGHLEASIDFGEDEVIGEETVVPNCTRRLKTLADEIEGYIKFNSYSNQLLREGIDVTILGPPNVGKSTLMNLLCQNEKSIVSDLKGTTRDVIEHMFDLNGFAIKLSDTAGLHDIPHYSSSDSDVASKHLDVEVQGMRKALNIASKSDVLLYLLDINDILKTSNHDSIDNIIYDSVRQNLKLKLSAKLVYFLLNKSDLNPTLVETFLISDKLKTLANNIGQILGTHVLIETISCKHKPHYDRFIDNLTCAIKNFVIKSQKTMSFNRTKGEELFYINERHISLLCSALKNIREATTIDFENLEIAAQLVRNSTGHLSRIAGDVENEKILDVIFSDFCIGK